MIPRLLCSGLIILFLLAAGCSSTVMTGSWKSPDFTGQVKKVYIIGIAKSDATRRLFEDAFRAELATYGVTGLLSYNDLPAREEINKQVIAASADENGADAIMITRATSKETEQIVNRGTVSGRYVDYGPREAYIPESYCRTYGSYFERSCVLVFQPASKNQDQLLTIEANLYDTKTSELIWSAHLETSGVHDLYDLHSLFEDYVKSFTLDLKAKGLI